MNRMIFIKVVGLLEGIVYGTAIYQASQIR